jgi:hypothetical protein
MEEGERRKALAPDKIAAEVADLRKKSRTTAAAEEIVPHAIDALKERHRKSAYVWSRIKNFQEYKLARRKTQGPLPAGLENAFKVMTGLRRGTKVVVTSTRGHEHKGIFIGIGEGILWRSAFGQEIHLPNRLEKSNEPLPAIVKKTGRKIAVILLKSPDGKIIPLVGEKIAKAQLAA